MKSYVISVSYCTGCYRHIQISASATLYQLHKAILNAFQFTDDHAHAFFMDDHYWGHGDAFFSMKMNSNDRLSKSARLYSFHFEKGSKFKYLFDFGDEWRFQCKFLRELEERTDIPRILRSVGESPEQYPEEDDLWDEDLWDESDDEEDWEDDAFTQEEIDALYAMIPLKKSTIQEIQQYFDAASRLYGIITLDQLYDIYIRQNAIISKEYFLMVVAMAAQEEHQYVIKQCGALTQTNIDQDLASLEIAAEYLFYMEDTRDYDRLKRKQGTTEYKVLPKKEFLRYADVYGHPSTKQHQELLAFLKKKEKDITESAAHMCHAIQNFLMLDVPFMDILHIMEPYGLHIDRKTELLPFENMIKELEQCTPKHIYRGHTPEEMFALSKKGKRLAERNAPENQLSLFDEPEQKPQLTLVGNPARNSPCPCGSGRKYKNCCGKSK